MGVTARQVQVWFRNRRQRVRLAQLAGKDDATTSHKRSIADDDGVDEKRPAQASKLTQRPPYADVGSDLGAPPAVASPTMAPRSQARQCIEHGMKQWREILPQHQDVQRPAPMPNVDMIQAGEMPHMQRDAFYRPLPASRGFLVPGGYSEAPIKARVATATAERPSTPLHPFSATHSHQMDECAVLGSDPSFLISIVRERAMMIEALKRQHAGVSVRPQQTVTYHPSAMRRTAEQRPRVVAELASPAIGQNCYPPPMSPPMARPPMAPATSAPLYSAESYMQPTAIAVPCMGLHPDGMQVLGDRMCVHGSGEEFGGEILDEEPVPSAPSQAPQQEPLSEVHLQEFLRGFLAA